ncbi:MAG: asparagine synthase-related protein [Solirubrobacterales bacterium]
MSRWLAGVFDPHGRASAAGLAAALQPYAASELDSPPLHLAYSGPAPGSSGPLCLLDGFLDNSEEIRRELLSAGWELGEQISDEELLAAGYRRWGQGLLERLRGDFALLLWDGERGEGLLARDQLGVRPLFLHEAGGVLRFAGELRHLLALLPRQPGPDPAGVAHWIAVSNRPGTQTLYSGVRRLGPGEALKLARSGARPVRYWVPRFVEPLDLDPGELAAQVRAGLKQAVERRIADKGSTGVLMSGGLDSTSVAALCTEVNGAEVCACAAIFPDHPDADESELIGELRSALDLPGLTAEVYPGGLLAAALEHLAAWRAPLLGWGDFWALPLMRAAAEVGVGTMLDGDGGDELFGPRSYLLADCLRAGHPLQALALAHELPGAGPHVARREVAQTFGSLAMAGALPGGPHNALQACLTRREAPSWLLRSTVDDLVSYNDSLAWKRLDGPRWWAHAAHGLAYGIEEAGVFEHQRRRAALAGMEARHPLLDFDLVSLCLRQPPLATLDRRFTRPVLRASMEELLPDSVRLRSGKASFGSMIVDSLTGPDAVAVRGILSDPKAELRAYLDQGEMRRALLDTDVLRRRAPFRWMWQVWRLLNAEVWLRSQTSQKYLEITGSSLPSPARVDIRASYLFPP